MSKQLILLMLAISLVSGCRNHDINEGEQFRPREINEDFNNFHFNKITYDGVEYLITERDNNHPHEGFGFMAVKANDILYNQDSIMAHLETQAAIQKMIYASLFGISPEQSDSIYLRIFENELRKIAKRRISKQNKNSKKKQD